MKRPRLRISTLMIVVAIAGSAFGAWRIRGRAVEYRRKFGSHANDEEFYRMALSGKWRLGHPSYVPIFRERLTYHETLRRKYQRAARYPWLSVAPDPPEPE